MAGGRKKKGPGTRPVKPHAQRDALEQRADNRMRHANETTRKAVLRAHRDGLRDLEPAIRKTAKEASSITGPTEKDKSAKHLENLRKHIVGQRDRSAAAKKAWLTRRKSGK